MMDDLMRIGRADEIENKDKSNIKYFIFYFLIWGLSPYLSIFIGFFLLCKIKINRKSLRVIFFFISLSFALLAYTQKSIVQVGTTDIERYYGQYAPLLHSDFSILPLLLASDSLTYIFTPVNILIVLITKNVPVISIFWTFIIYYFCFLSVYNFISIYDINYLADRKKIILTIIFIIFGCVLFTQVTETIKSAAAITIFWYIFSIYLKDGWSLKILFLLFLDVGIHAQALLLLPVFLYKRFDYFKLLIITILLIVLCTQINVINLVVSVLPSNTWSNLLKETIEGYGTVGGAYSSKRYIFEGLLCMYISYILFKKKNINNTNKFGNIILIYICIMFLNFNNSEAFVRFANFISFIATIEFIMLLGHKRTMQLAIVLLGIFIMLNFQMTYGRTLSGGYCSSYMDNSIYKVLFSNVCDYLSYKAY